MLGSEDEDLMRYMAFLHPADHEAGSRAAHNTQTPTRAARTAGGGGRVRLIVSTNKRLNPQRSLARSLHSVLARCWYSSTYM